MGSSPELSALYSLKKERIKTKERDAIPKILSRRNISVWEGSIWDALFGMLCYLNIQDRFIVLDMANIGNTLDYIRSISLIIDYLCPLKLKFIAVL